MKIEKYFKDIEMQVKAIYSVAEAARLKGLDPRSFVEIPLASSLAERVTGLLSVKYPQLKDEKIVARIKELEKEHGLLDHAVALKIAEEVAKEKFCKFKDHLEAVDAGIRIGFAYITVGVVSSPLEGFTHFQLKKTKKNEDYFCAYYSGPVRSAGGTAAAFSLLLIDHLREIFGYAKYDPDEKEIQRAKTEIYDYHERITNLQYLPSEEEIDFLMRNVPVQINGEPSEDKEVSNYKDLARIETNFMRNGFCLVLAESLAQKAPKILKIITKLRKRGFKLSDWNFLEGFVELQKKLQQKKKETDSSATYIQDLVAGRPVLGHPSRQGGFRLRYGRSRFSGLSSMAMSPYTMAVLDNFIAVGTQLKYEGPGKSSAMTPCDSIDGPIVKLNNGCVIKIDSDDKLRKAREKGIKEILHLGDFLVNYGEYFNRGKRLQKPGYCCEWYVAELERKNPGEDVKELIENPWIKISFEKALEISKKYDLPLHPDFIYYWSHLDKELFFSLLDWIAHSKISENKLLLPYNKTEQERFRQGKRALELIGAEHEVVTENILLNEEESKALLFNLGINLEEDIEERINSSIEKIRNEEDVLKMINLLCALEIKDKAGSYIGARMGRPEKAKLRKLVGSPNVLFPVGDEGGRLRSVNEALEAGTIKADFPIYFCRNCQKETIYFKCENCNNECDKFYYCPECQQKFTMEKCPEHLLGLSYINRRIDSNYYFQQAIKKLDLLPDEIPKLVKGVKGTSNKNHMTENLAKGILRAIYNLQVNKDGTIRYDITEQALTHFKAKEIGISVERLRELGYEKDINGNELEDEGQLVELMPLDVILPSCQESANEKADEVLINIANFIDHLLLKLYGLKSFYNIRGKEDLIGQLIVGLAPHTSAGIIGRVIGFSKTQGCIANPLWHAAMRRDCLGYDSYVPIKKNNSWNIVKIGEFIEKEKPGQKADLYGTLKKSLSGVKIYSNPGESEILELTKHMPRKLIRIYLEDGRKIETTDNHKFYVKDKKEKKALDLRVGDKLIVSYKKEIEERDIKEIFLPGIFQDREDVMIRNVKSYLKKFENLSKYKNFYHRDSFPIKLVKEILDKNNKSLHDLPSNAKIAIKRNGILIPTRIPVDEQLLEVLGLYIAEGFSRKKETRNGFFQISIAGNQEIKNLVKKIFSLYFNLKPNEDHPEHVTFSSRIIYELFKDILKLGERAREKRIPSIFLNLKKEKLAALLRGYFEGDGSVSSTDIRVSCDTISEGLKQDLSFVLSRFGIFTKFYEYEKEPGPKVREFYIRKNRIIPKFKITKITIPSNFVNKFRQIGFISERKNKILDELCKRNAKGMKIDLDESYVYPRVIKIEELGEEKSYCFNVSSEHNFFANDILVHNCEGDETCVMLLLDALINFSREYLPAHRGSTQDAPLVITIGLNPAEVDDMVFDMDVVWRYPLELYEAAEKELNPWDIKIEQIKDRLGTEKQYHGFGFTHHIEDINNAVRYSAYKSLPNMMEKVNGQMKIAELIRAVNVGDVARLIIDRHLIRDIRGNLRKFSQQEFRCSKCNEKYRRPPLTGKCLNCNGNIIFTISEGSIVKYLEPALQLANKYNVPSYVKQSLELTKSYIESIFGKEKEKQEGLKKWF